MGSLSRILSLLLAILSVIQLGVTATPLLQARDESQDNAGSGLTIPTAAKRLYLQASVTADNRRRDAVITDDSGVWANHTERSEFHNQTYFWESSTGFLFTNIIDPSNEGKSRTLALYVDGNGVWRSANSTKLDQLPAGNTNLFDLQEPNGLGELVGSPQVVALRNYTGPTLSNQPLTPGFFNGCLMDGSTKHYNITVSLGSGSDVACFRTIVTAVYF